MDITVSSEQGRVPVTVIHVKGDINMSSAEQLMTQARQAYDSGARDILIDLSDAPYMSSAGIRALHELFKMLRTDEPSESDETMRKGLADGSYKSPHLKLLKPNRHVGEVLNMAGYDMFLEIYHNLEDAVASF